MKKTVTFSCPVCQVRVPVFCVVLTDEDFILLMGTCLQCNENYRFNVETILKELYSSTTHRYVH